MKQFPLGELADIKIKTLNPAQYPNEIFSLFSIPAYDSGVPEIIKGQNIKSSKTIIHDGDILISKLNPRIPRVWLVKKRNDFRQICSTEFIPFHIKKNFNMDSEYLSWMLLAPQFMKHLQDMVKSSTKSHQRVRPHEIAELLIPYPPIDEQHRIVSRIKECMERVDEIETLRTESEKEEAGAFLKSFYHELYEELVVTYPTGKLSDTGMATGGGTPSKKRSDFWNGNIPWVSPKEMKQRDIFNTSLSISEKAVEGSSVKLIEHPSVLFVVRGMILSHTFPVAVNRVPVTINQDMKAITPNKNIQVDYLAAMLRGAEQRLLSRIEVAGHGTKRLQTQHWASLPIPMIDVEKQNNIISRVEEVQEIADNLLNDIKSKEINLIRQSILRKAFAGEL